MLISSFFSYVKEVKYMFEIPKPDQSKMIWVFVSEDDKIIIPFQGSEQEAYDYWDILAERGMRIDRNPYTPLL